MLVGLPFVSLSAFFVRVFQSVCLVCACVFVGRSVLCVHVYIKYPIHLALSILCVIPKKGNLKMPKNFRGIQMMRAIACLFDRVIARRLCAWMNIEAEQSAFQKGKSTIIQIFILRLLIEREEDVIVYCICRPGESLR